MGAGGCCFASLTAGCYVVRGAGGCCFAGATGHAVWGAGRCCFASLTAGWGLLVCELAGGLDGRVLGGMQFRVLVDASLTAGCWGHAVWGAGGCCFVFRAGRVLGACRFWGAGGCCFASLTAGCWGACSLGCWWMLFCELAGC